MGDGYQIINLFFFIDHKKTKTKKKQNKAQKEKKEEDWKIKEHKRQKKEKEKNSYESEKKNSSSSIGKRKDKGKMITTLIQETSNKWDSLSSLLNQIKQTHEVMTSSTSSTPLCGVQPFLFLSLFFSILDIHKQITNQKN